MPYFDLVMFLGGSAIFGSLFNNWRIDTVRLRKRNAYLERLASVNREDVKIWYDTRVGYNRRIQGKVNNLPVLYAQAGHESPVELAAGLTEVEDVAARLFERGMTIDRAPIWLVQTAVRDNSYIH